MKTVFYAEDCRIDRRVSEAFRLGAERHGDRFAVRDAARFGTDVEQKVDVAVIAGGRRKDGFDAWRRAGKHVVIVDKGYTRGYTPLTAGRRKEHQYWRVSIDAQQPHHYFREVPRPPDRWEATGGRIAAPVCRPGGYVVFAGSSQRYCDWYGLGDAHAYATGVLRGLRLHTDLELVYRTKMSARDAAPVPGTRFSHGKSCDFSEVLEGAACVVTYGSNAAFESLLAGVPAIVLGDGIARSLSRTRVEDVENLLRPAEAEIYRLACDVAYCQFTTRELSSGEAWCHLRTQLDRPPAPHPVA